MESIRLTTTLSAAPEDVYDAWITGKRHAEMTGSPATSEKRKGGSYTAWDGYISGKYLELEAGTRVLQTWRTTEFPETAPDSRLEVRFGKSSRGTQLTVLQSGIPDGQGEMYTEGWQDHYFDPMSEYFRTTATRKRPSAEKPTPKKAVRHAAPTKTKATAKKTAPAPKAATGPAKKKSVKKKK